MVLEYSSRLGGLSFTFPTKHYLYYKFHVLDNIITANQASRSRERERTAVTPSIFKAKQSYMQEKGKRLY